VIDLDLLGNLSFRRLAHFVTVAETGTFSRAAQTLFMSQSAVSDSVSELERLLGAQLLIRTRGRGISLTTTGTTVLATARALLDEAAELNHLAHGRDGELVGPLSIGCFVTLAPTVLPGLLIEYERRHRQVTLDFSEGAQDVLEHRLMAGELDVAIMYDLDLATELDRVVLYESSAYALFGPEHPLARQDSVTLEQLEPEPLILFDTPPTSSYGLLVFEHRGLSPNVRYRAHGYELVRSIVARSDTYYAVLVPRPPHKLSFEGLPIVELEIEPAVPTCPVVIAWPSSRRLTRRAQALVEIARQRFEG
jgi:DNA-binding transcriptional LysR family regulator